MNSYRDDVVVFEKVVIAHLKRRKKRRTKKRKGKSIRIQILCDSALVHTSTEKFHYIRLE